MNPRKIVRDDIKKLTPADRSVLCALYLYRCLTLEQMRIYFYAKENSKLTYAEWHLKKLIDQAFVQEAVYGQQQKAYFLDTTGIIVAKRLFEIESTVCVGAPNRCKDYDWKSKDLHLHWTMLNHQITLNEFALQFSEMATLLNVEYEYFDEKYNTNKMFFSCRARPDAVIQLKNRTLYIEMDLNTENKACLMRKWDRYRILTNTKEMSDMMDTKPADIIFITQNAINPDVRRRNVIRSIESNFLDCLSGKLNMHIGTQEEMLDYIFSALAVPNQERKSEQMDLLYKQKAVILEPLPPIQMVPSYGYRVSINNTELLLDFYEIPDGSIWNKAAMSNKNEMLINCALGRRIPYVIVCSDFNRAILDFKKAGCFDMNSLYFVNRNALSDHTLLSSLQKIDSFGKEQQAQI